MSGIFETCRNLHVIDVDVDVDVDEDELQEMSSNIRPLQAVDLLRFPFTYYLGNKKKEYFVQEKEINKIENVSLTTIIFQLH